MSRNTHGRQSRYKCTEIFTVRTVVYVTTCMYWNCTSSLLAAVTDISKTKASFLKLANIGQ